MRSWEILTATILSLNSSTPPRDGVTERRLPREQEDLLLKWKLFVFQFFVLLKNKKSENGNNFFPPQNQLILSGLFLNKDAPNSNIFTKT